jgi:hypothetical protein
MKQLKRWIIPVLILSLLVLSHGARAQTNKFEGKPVFAEGKDLGYYVWREDRTWHVRWTTKGLTRRFSGSVVAVGGDLNSLNRIDVEQERRVLYPGRAPRVVYGPRGRPHLRGGRAPVVVTGEQDRIEKDGDNKIVFIALTNNDIDGFDFKVDEGVISLRFLLEIDGKLFPQNVEVGRNNQKLSSLPLVVELDSNPK